MAVHAPTVNLCAVKAQRPKDAWIMVEIVLLTVKEWMASATNAALLVGNTYLVPLTIAAELVLLFPFPVAWVNQ